MADRLEDIAGLIMTRGKGLLAADESTGTITKRFDAVGIDSTPETRRDYREMLLTAEEAMAQSISGVIFFDETIHQKTSTGTPFPDLVSAAGAIPGIKVDKSTVPLAGHRDEAVTEGLDGLRERLTAYRAMGARFAKWRATISISQSLPTAAAVRANTHVLARYAALCQEADIVPVVEPEVLMDHDPGDHSIDRCYDVTEWTLRTLFSDLAEQRVVLEGTILKPNMVIDGTNARRAGVDEVAEKTVRCFKACVPAAIAGIAFLSGGQSEREATAHLSAMNGGFDKPWPMTFSYGRALQAPALEAWAGKRENVAAGQRAFVHRARMNAMAALGDWREDLEKAA